MLALMAGRLAKQTLTFVQEGKVRHSVLPRSPSQLIPFTSGRPSSGPLSLSAELS